MTLCNCLSQTKATLTGERHHVYKSEALFAGASAIQINHHGAIYTLRITQLGKLILTK